MSAESIITFINTVGFPIACVIALGCYVRDLTKEHKEEMVKLTEVINTMSLEIKDLGNNIREALERNKTE